MPMKSVIADPATSVVCTRYETVSGVIFRFIAYPHDLEISGNTYVANPFSSPTDITANADLSPTVFDAESYFGAGGITRAQLDSGLLDNARVYTFKTSWANPVVDEEKVSLTFMGKSRVEDDTFNIEHMDLVDALNQKTGSTVVAKCPYVFGDKNLDGDIIATDRSRCTGPRSAPDGPDLDALTVSGTVTHVTSNSVWRDSGRSEAVDYFTYGSILWTSGNNAGLRSFEIKSYLANGTVETHQSAYYDIEVGDGYDMTPGCDHDLEGDCSSKWSNGINYGGYPHLITEEAYSYVGQGE